jgi:hypothetical protein
VVSWAIRSSSRPRRPDRPPNLRATFRHRLDFAGAGHESQFIRAGDNRLDHRCAATVSVLIREVDREFGCPLGHKASRSVDPAWLSDENIDSTKWYGDHR